MTVRTGKPAEALRTYRLSFDANGGSFGTGADGSAVVGNVVTYDARNVAVGGAYAVPSRDGCDFLGWSSDSDATGPDADITLDGGVADAWMCSRADGSTTTLYAVWRVPADVTTVRYAVSAYGIGIDRDASGDPMGVTFGPALGYPEFSVYDGYDYDASSTQTYTRSHTVGGSATVMGEGEPACMDSSHSVITGDDAGTDAAGNPYRCLHYDNWATIAWWNAHDPHVYDRCVSHRCTRTVVITPSDGAVASGTFDDGIDDAYRGLVGDGQSWVVRSDWNMRGSGVDVTAGGRGYSASLVRARLVGADSHTRAEQAYAGSDAMSRLSSDASILACFPPALRRVIGAKALSGVGAACSGTGMRHDVTSNDGVSDMLWLPSSGEMTSGVYPGCGFSSDVGKPDAARSNMQPVWLRSPDTATRVYSVAYDGVCTGYGSGMLSGLGVAPCFALVGGA